MNSPEERPNLELVDGLEQPDDLLEGLTPLPDVIAQPILDREARVEARARHRAESNPRSQIADRFANLSGRLRRRYK